MPKMTSAIGLPRERIALPRVSPASPPSTNRTFAPDSASKAAITTFDAEKDEWVSTVRTVSDAAPAVGTPTRAMHASTAAATANREPYM